MLQVKVELLNFYRSAISLGGGTPGPLPLLGPSQTQNRITRNWITWLSPQWLRGVAPPPRLRGSAYAITWPLQPEPI